MSRDFFAKLSGYVGVPIVGLRIGPTWGLSADGNISPQRRKKKGVPIAQMAFFKLGCAPKFRHGRGEFWKFL